VIRRTLPRDAARALALARAHPRRFAAPVLLEESEALAIDALVALGRMEEAHAARAAFGRAHPMSPHRRRLDRALAGP
jgi:hypothetical protein